VQQHQQQPQHYRKTKKRGRHHRRHKANAKPRPRPDGVVAVVSRAAQVSERLQHEVMTGACCDEDIHWDPNDGQVHTGKWPIEEERFAYMLIRNFEDGTLTDCPEGTTLRSYLAKTLRCAPMRISKKFAGKCVGSKTFVPRSSSSSSSLMPSSTSSSSSASSSSSSSFLPPPQQFLPLHVSRSEEWLPSMSDRPQQPPVDAAPGVDAGDAGVAVATAAVGGGMVAVTVYGPPICLGPAVFASSSADAGMGGASATLGAASAATSFGRPYGGRDAYDDDASSSTSGDDRHDASSGSSSDGGLSDVPSPVPDPQNKRRRLVIDGRGRTPPPGHPAAALASSASFARDVFDRPAVDDHDEWRQALSEFFAHNADIVSGVGFDGDGGAALSGGIKRSPFPSGIDLSTLT